MTPNKLPKDWKIVELKDVTSIIGDGLHGTPKYTIESDYYFINGNNLGNGKITIKENTKKVSIEEYEKYKKKLNDKTVLVSINGTLGNIAFYNNEKVILGKSACYFNVLDCLDKKYIYILLSGLEFLNYAHKSATGSTIPNVSLKTMREFKFPLPPLKTQQLIVSKIEELFSELDKGIEDLKLAQQQLKTYRQSVLKYAFEGKLTNKKVKDGVLPKGWKVVTIGDIAKVGTGATPLKGNKNFYENGKIAWVTSGALNNEFVREATDYVTDLALNETNLSLYPKHTLLLAMYGEGKTRGKCSELLIEATTNQAIAAISFENHDIRVKSFLKYFLLKNYNDIRMLSSGGVQPNLNLGIVKKTSLPFPSLDEQYKIIQEIESRLSVADKMEESINQSLLQAEALRQSILKKAFEGKLV